MYKKFRKVDNIFL